MVAVADPATGGERLEQTAVETARRAQIGVLDHRVLSQSGEVQPSTEPLVVTRGDLMVDQQPKPVLARQIVGCRLVVHVEERVPQ